MRLKKGFLLILFLALTSCASNNSTPTPPRSQSNAGQAVSKKDTETIQSASGEKCIIDEKRICEEGAAGVANDPFGADNSEDIRERIASGDDTGGSKTYTSTLRYGVSLLQGERPVNLFCGMNMHQRAFAYGQLSTSGTPTDTDVAKLRAGGYCSN